MSMQHVQCVLLLLILAVNSDRFQITELHALTLATPVWLGMRSLGMGLCPTELSILA